MHGLFPAEKMCYDHDAERGLKSEVMRRSNFSTAACRLYAAERQGSSFSQAFSEPRSSVFSLAETMQAAAAEKRAAEAAQAEADKAKEDEAINSDEDDGGEMPGIEVLSDADEDRAAD